MICITAVEGCRNTSGFVEKSFYDYYGCMDTSVAVRYKRNRVCGIGCSFGCTGGELSNFFLDHIIHMLFFLYISMQCVASLVAIILVAECADAFVTGYGVGCQIVLGAVYLKYHLKIAMSSLQKRENT